ncbi:hypothetical protein D3C72_1756590 [compost metagenome]
MLLLQRFLNPLGLPIPLKLQAHHFFELRLAVRASRHARTQLAGQVQVVPLPLQQRPDGRTESKRSLHEDVGIVLGQG